MAKDKNGAPDAAASGREDENIAFSVTDQLHLKTVHDAIDRPDKFAELFCQAAKTQTSVKEVLWEQIRSILTTDVEARNALKVIVREVEKEDVRIFGKKIGFGVWTLFTIGMGAFLGALFTKFL
ncbi:hypothetical protein IPH19_01410 [Candidatus Uhrbacteria bacterium]|nr:MAG: hypothetical protein IPH19_01410 [Candidatus Uhrbacteria bacterium]